MRQKFLIMMTSQGRSPDNIFQLCSSGRWRNASKTVPNAHLTTLKAVVSRKVSKKTKLPSNALENFEGNCKFVFKIGAHQLMTISINT